MVQRSKQLSLNLHKGDCKFVWEFTNIVACILSVVISVLLLQFNPIEASSYIHIFT